MFYSSNRFVFETAFISEQIVENRFGALLEISDKLITKFNLFSCMTLQVMLYDFKNWLGSFAWKVIVCTTNVSDELSEMRKDLKIKDSVSSSSKYQMQWLKWC